MPPRPKRFRPATRRSQSSPLVEAHADVRAQFDRLVTNGLGPLLSNARVARLRHDPAVVSSFGGGVVVHAAVKLKGPLTLDRIKRERPILGVVVNSLPLIEPFSLRELKPGAYVVRVRKVGTTSMAFDYFTEKGRPAFSARAEPTKPIPMNPKEPIAAAALDVDIILPWDPDDLWPPTNSTNGKFCLSLFSWSHCWEWNWPSIRWPW